MRKLYSFIFIILFSYTGFSQNFFNYKISKPYCVLNFLQSVTGSHGTSPSFKQFIISKSQNDNEFILLTEEYSKLNLNDVINREGFPEGRKQSNSVFDLIVANAASSNTLEEFKIKCLGLIPLETNQKLYKLLKEAEKKYDELVWITNKDKMKKQFAELSKFEKTNEAIFNKIRNFYDSSWTSDIPFQVVIYPIPGFDGFSTATPHVNTLCVGVFTDEVDYASRNGVVLHEMCHVLYKEQKLSKQYDIEEYFKDNNTLYSRFAYSYLDEALATAIGNGWAYKVVNNKLDEGEWYADATINAFAKLIYPMVEQYMQKGKSIDREFINEAIKLFARNFPKSIQEYSILLNKTTVYADDLTEIEMVNKLADYFQVYSLSLSSPIIHKYSFELMENSKDTQLFIIHKNQNQTLNEIKKYFPQIENYKFEDKPLNLSFFDLRGRAVIVLVLNNKEEIKTELLKTKKQGFFDIKQPLQY